MPLDKSGTKESFSRNVATERNAGKPMKQALAIAYSVKRAGRAAGGRVVEVAGLKAKIENEKGSIRSKVGSNGKRWSTVMPDHYGHIQRTEGSDGDHVDCYIGPSPKSDKVYIIDQLNAETGKFDEHKCMLGYSNQSDATKAYQAAFSDGKGKQRMGSVTELPVDRFRDWVKSGRTMKPMSNGIPHRASGGSVMDVAYRIKREARAAGGPAPTPWQVRSEAKSMTHSGPIMSAVPGRTDKHPVSVAPGSYVVNADSVSHIGQNNTMAGQAILSQMFGRNGPYGGKSMGITRGKGAPPAPHMAKPRADGGAAEGEGAVDIIVAGGEFTIPPDIVANIGSGDVERGHEILDHWMKQNRKDHIRTLQRLPGPAKS